MAIEESRRETGGQEEVSMGRGLGQGVRVAAAASNHLLVDTCGDWKMLVSETFACICYGRCCYCWSVLVA